MKTSILLAAAVFTTLTVLTNQSLLAQKTAADQSGILLNNHIPSEDDFKLRTSERFQPTSGEDTDASVLSNKSAGFAEKPSSNLFIDPAVIEAHHAKYRSQAPAPKPANEDMTRNAVQLDYQPETASAITRHVRTDGWHKTTSDPQ